MSEPADICVPECVSPEVSECVTLSAYLGWLCACPRVLVHGKVRVWLEVQTSVCLGERASVSVCMSVTGSEGLMGFCVLGGCDRECLCTVGSDRELWQLDIYTLLSWPGSASQRIPEL